MSKEFNAFKYINKIKSEILRDPLASNHTISKRVDPNNKTDYGKRVTVKNVRKKMEVR